MRLEPCVLSLPTRRAGASAVELDDNVAVYDDVGQLLILLNTSAAAVWERCDGRTTVDDMVRALAVEHGAHAEDIAEDVRRTLAKLAELGLVAEAGPRTGDSSAG
ncbi:MAG TPA: PqqD family protein [Acidimicrobiales bacterium]